ncbi:hypothetical protein QTN47_17410 [Danxiaibacter flavus]|uniref:Uncharacterized protein n=1 Tax=Danxiaibacter flavus TaxID=3049108 RepID=A0ABV3ZHC5_9BACT|nr:hypothetical protein QNM32_17420 [Chitinophagaceae bacterium DXS]
MSISDYGFSYTFQFFGLKPGKTNDYYPSAEADGNELKSATGQ